MDKICYNDESLNKNEDDEKIMEENNVLNNVLEEENLEENVLSKNDEINVLSKNDEITAPNTNDAINDNIANDCAITYICSGDVKEYSSEQMSKCKLCCCGCLYNFYDTFRSNGGGYLDADSKCDLCLWCIKDFLYSISCCCGCCCCCQCCGAFEDFED